MKSWTSVYDEKWQKHCVEFGNYNCGKFDIIVNELMECGFITIQESGITTDFDERL